MGKTKVYYVEGSNLFSVPKVRMNEVGHLREEFHSQELKKA